MDGEFRIVGRQLDVLLKMSNLAKLLLLIQRHLASSLASEACAFTDLCPILVM
jgi:hypothetical protein